MILMGSSELVRNGGAEGSRTLTGWNLNPVPLPVGLRPLWCCVGQRSRTRSRGCHDIGGRGPEGLLSVIVVSVRLLGVRVERSEGTSVRRSAVRVWRWLTTVLIDRFEERGVYVPGEDNKAISPWRDFGWLIAGFLVAVAVFILLFALGA